MALPLLRMIERLIRRLRAWPRRLVLRATGEPVELIALHELDGRRRCVVELRGGRRIEVLERELESRFAAHVVAAAAVIGLALAAGGALAERGGRASLEAACPPPAEAPTPAG
jgi:hypothetical protein